MKKLLVSLALLTAGLGLYLLWAEGPTEHRVRRLPVLIGCQEWEQQGALVFEGQLRVLARALPQAGKSQDWIQEQLKYSFFALHYQWRDRSNRFFVAEDPAEVRILRTEMKPYGQRQPRNPSTPAQRGIYASFWDKGTGIEASDPALWVTYSAKLPVRACGSHLPSHIPLVLPLDPYAYKLTLLTTEEEKRSLHSVKAKFAPERRKTIPWSVPAAWKAPELRLSFVFGRIGRLAKNPDAIFLKSLTLPTLGAEWDALLAQEEKRDVGLGAYHKFVRELPQILDHLRFTPVRETYLLVEGTLKATGQRLQLRLRYGNTEMVEAISETNARFILDTFKDADLFVYLGPSRQGRSMDLKRLAQLVHRPWEKVARDLRQRPHSFYGVAGSYTLGPFAKEIREARQGLPTDILLSASSHYMHDLPNLILNVLITGELSYPASWEREYYLTWERLGPEHP